MAKDILNSSQIQEKILFGVNLVADTVRVTLGPKGRNTVLQSKPLPLVTNYGAVAAEKIQSEAPGVQMGVDLIREAATRTKEAVGDGSTTAVVLTQAIINAGMKSKAAGVNPIEMKKGLQGAAQLAAAAIRKLSHPIPSRDGLAAIAEIASGDPLIGQYIADALEAVGPEGIVTVEDSPTALTEVKITEGMQFDRGYLRPEFITNQDTMCAELETPFVLITDCKITAARQLLPILEQVIPTGRPVLLAAETVEGEALGLLVVNTQRKVLQAVAIHPPAYGEGRRDFMEDLAVFTGGQFISQDMGIRLEDVTLDMLGSAGRAVIGKGKTAILNGGGAAEAIEERKALLRVYIRHTDYDFKRSRYEERLAKFSGGIAVIQAGAATEAEQKDWKTRITGALAAAKSARAEGIVPGGGVIYLNIFPAIEAYRDSLSGDRRTGAGILLSALEAPARQIAENAGLDGSSVVAHLRQMPAGTGYHIETGEYTDMLEAGVADAAKVARTALQNAVSLASILLTVEAGVCEHI